MKTAKKQGGRKSRPLTSRQKQERRYSAMDAAALRDGVLKNGRPANGGEAVTLWLRGEYKLVKEKEA